MYLHKSIKLTANTAVSITQLGNDYRYYWVKNAGDEDIYATTNDIGEATVASLIAAYEAGTSTNTIKIEPMSASRLDGYTDTFTLFSDSAGLAEIDLSDAYVSPFKVQGKGGGSGGDGSTKYIGTTTTALSNGSTTNPITVDGESYTAQFGDIAVYNYTEFIFDGTTWSEFGRDFDTTPTSGSANAVTSNGIYDLIHKGSGTKSTVLGSNTSASGLVSTAMGTITTASGNISTAMGQETVASGTWSTAMGLRTVADQNAMTAMGKFNSPRAADLFNIGNGTADNARSNIVEVNSTSLNVNGDIKKNGVSLGNLAYKDSASGTAVTNVVYDSVNERFIITVGTVTVS